MDHRRIKSRFKKLIPTFFFSLWCFFPFFIHFADAHILTAQSCNRDDVQSAIDSALTGDLVFVPEGNCTWERTLAIPDNKKLTLQGASIDGTVITRTPSGLAIDLNQSGSRVTGFTFNDGHITADGDGWRIDHCKFNRNTSFGSGVIARGVQKSSSHPTGLVDNCSFLNTRVLIFGSVAMLHENDTQHRLWTNSLDLGTDGNVVYVEDCDFLFSVFGNAIDANYGGAYVFRFNRVTNVYIECHSVQGNNRAARRWEIYGNRLVNHGSPIYFPFRIRGGTGVVFNNIIVRDHGKLTDFSC